MNELQDFLDEELKNPMEKFFVFIAKNALQYNPPLTFFNNIRTQTLGKSEVFDIKNAMTPVVDLVRVYALQNRIFKLNTGERLKALQEKGVFSETQFHELMQSYYYLMSLRLKNQASQVIHEKIKPNNYIELKNLTRIEQVTLKEIFKTIENFQAGIKMRFTNNLLG
ncbi:putative nucleotidyltransferase substrate binding domain-containing protein [Pedobacter aquae]|uniref:putative nucleotidyltransferase substrate binding domain-containing protein n=1 Tax=Pedobacter aquae TaxID=2605747 RepID=UPI001F0B2BB8|nr:putative nucleotidyltransferase substrate binding domain-containing protein [Pedobacter aquae]